MSAMPTTEQTLRAEIVWLQLCVSCLLPIAEATTNPIDAATCRLIRQGTGRLQKALRVVGGMEAQR